MLNVHFFALKSIAKANCPQILRIIESDKKGKESEKFLGYDFDLWIGTNNKFVRYIIQSKSQKSDYTLYGKYEINSLQLTRLERYAISQRKTAIPLYAFYKFLNEPVETLEKNYNSNDQFTPENLGNTISTTEKIKRYNDITFIDLHKLNKRISDWIELFYNKPDSLALYLEIMNATIPLHELSNFKISQAIRVNESF